MSYDCLIQNGKILATEYKYEYIFKTRETVMKFENKKVLLILVYANLRIFYYFSIKVNPDGEVQEK